MWLYENLGPAVIVQNTALVHSVADIVLIRWNEQDVSSTLASLVRYLCFSGQEADSSLTQAATPQTFLFSQSTEKGRCNNAFKSRGLGPTGILPSLKEKMALFYFSVRLPWILKRMRT